MLTAVNLKMGRPVIYSVLMMPKTRPKRESALNWRHVKTLFHDPVGFAVKGLLILVASSSVATGLAHSILII